jgi:hypothetical protein
MKREKVGIPLTNLTPYGVLVSVNTIMWLFRGIFGGYYDGQQLHK